MYQDNIVLCGASAYEQKFYFNQDFNALPDHVKKELQIMCVLFTEDVGGILTFGVCTGWNSGIQNRGIRGRRPL